MVRPGLQKGQKSGAATGVRRQPSIANRSASTQQQRRKERLEQVAAAAQRSRGGGCSWFIPISHEESAVQAEVSAALEHVSLSDSIDKFDGTATAAVDEEETDSGTTAWYPRDPYGSAIDG